ncbi:MAG: Type 1 glutamine amidotransferase-like domain-containing protein [Nanoarchaeota archaeon]|nr:Type 1 glutamine amidotransferase-like domain-containing protein [Nanoarchaeota archaeon]
MVKKIYLLGGAREEKTYADLDKEIVEGLENKSMLVIDFAKSDKEKIADKKERLKNHFGKLGIKSITFTSDYDSNEEIKKQISEVEFIHIVGGDTELLIEQLRQRDLIPDLKNFEGIIEGNSAGAMLLCREAICADEGREIIKGVGILNLQIDVHYNKTHDKKLIEISKDKKIYGIPEQSAIIVENGDLKFINEIYLFSEGKKQELN